MPENSAPNVGLEPTTLRLRVSCSTDWASRADREEMGDPDLYAMSSHCLEKAD